MRNCWLCGHCILACLLAFLLFPSAPAAQTSEPSYQAAVRAMQAGRLQEALEDIAQVRQGLKEPHEIAKPHRMGVAGMKLRFGGERKERTEWHSIIVWGKRAEGLAKLLHKGTRVFVEGQLRTRTWEKDGQKHYTTEINMTEIDLLSPKRERDGGDDGHD